jgi:hypothetical protein
LLGIALLHRHTLPIARHCSVQTGLHRL